MRFLSHSLWGIFLLSLTLVLLGLGIGQLRQASGDDGDGPGRPGAGAGRDEQVLAVRVMTVTPEAVAPVITAFGEVRARQSLDLRPSRTGRIVWAADGLADGVAVTAGAPLVRLDPAEPQAALALARADLAAFQTQIAEADATLALARDDLVAAEAQVTLQDRALARQRDLDARGAGSAAAVEAAEAARAQAAQSVLSRRQALVAAEAGLAARRTAVDRQRIAVTEAERGLAETEIRAPFGGVLASVAIVPGSLVGPADSLGRLIDPGDLEVAIRLSTAQFARLAGPDGAPVAAEVGLRLGEGDTAATARALVERAGAALGAGETGRVVFARIADPGAMRPGDIVLASVAEPPLHGADILPARALGADGAVLVIGEDDRLEVAAVAVLRHLGTEIIIDAAALAGREVVVERNPALGAGIRVEPRRDGAAAAASSDAG